MEFNHIPRGRLKKRRERFYAIRRDSKKFYYIVDERGKEAWRTRFRDYDLAELVWQELEFEKLGVKL